MTASSIPPPVLVLGLGNALMGDDGVGERLVALAARDPRLAGRVELACVGTDLLAAADRLRGRRVVLLVDALAAEEGLPIESPVLLDARAEELDRESPGAHSLSVAGCLRLLDAVEPEIAAAEVRIFGVPIERARVGPGLGRELEARLAGLAERLVAECLGCLAGRPRSTAVESSAAERLADW